jgi:flagellar assembly factor FliW
MEIITNRFGRFEVQADDILRFPAGLLGFEDCREWVLLADVENDALAWLQSIDRPEVAVAVVCPRRFVPAYQMRVARRELAALELDDPKQARVLAILGKTGRTITLNLKAPVVINLERRLGRQVVANDDHPVQYEMDRGTPAFRKSA